MKQLFKDSLPIAIGVAIATVIVVPLLLYLKGKVSPAVATA